MKKILILAGMMLTLSSCNPDSERAVIFDTDWWTDVDDACAIRVLKAASDDGTFDIRGICLSALRQTSIPSISSFLDYEGLGGIALGADSKAVGFNGNPCYHETLISENPAPSAVEVEDCVPFYRRILSESKGKVDIIVVGFSNSLSRLLESGPDSFSKLDGRHLVEKKVGHLWMMAGKYPSGSEHNFNLNGMTRKAAYKICTEWPTEITFLGFEVGVNVLAGSTLDDGDLLRKVLLVHGDVNGRSAWDPMTVQMAAMVNLNAHDLKEEYRNAGYETVKGTVTVNPEDGSNEFMESASGKHCYVKMLHGTDWYASMLDSILVDNSPISSLKQ